MNKLAQETAHYQWLELYTWVQPNGSVDFSRPRGRPTGMPIDPREAFHYHLVPQPLNTPMDPTTQPKAPLSPAQFELKRLRSSIYAVTRISGSSPLVEALQAVEHLFEIVLPDPNQQPQKPPLGLTPEYIDLSKSALERTREITEAIHRYAANGVLVPTEWVGELVLKVEQLEKEEAARPKWVHVWPKPNGVGRVDGDRNIVLYFPRELSDNEMRSLLDMAQHHAQLVPNKQPEAPAPCGDGGVTVLPDGSAFSTMSFPLPADHWLTAPACEQWDSARDESADLPYPILSRMLQSQVVDAARWAIRAATMRGQCQDFDPDAMVQNITYALCGPTFKTAKAG